MTPIMRDGKSIGVVDIGVPLGKPFVDNAKQRFGVDLAVYRFDGKGFASIASTLGDSSAATQDELKGVFDGAALRRDATLKGHPAALYLGQIKNYAGQPVAVIELVKDTTEYEAAAASSQRSLILGTLAILAGAALLAFLLGRGLSRPLRHRPASARLPPPPKSLPLPLPRSAARSHFPAVSPTRPWPRPRKPPKWSEALPPPPKRSAMCCA